MQAYQSKLSEWGQWFDGFVSSSDEVVDAHDIADVNLRCSLGLNENIDLHYKDCLGLIDEWSRQLIEYTDSNYRLFESEPESFENSREMYQAIAMVQFFQIALRVHYNMEFAEGEYDAIDARNLFLTGVLTGHGGQCDSTLPESFFYCMFGACAEEGRYVQDEWEVFMHFGRHSTGGPNDDDIELVRETNEVQKDLAFCTLICMRQYFNNAFDKLA